VRWLSDSFGAVLVGDNDPNEVVEAITTLLEDVEQRDALSARAREIGAIHHGGLIPKLVLESLALHDTK